MARARGMTLIEILVVLAMSSSIIALTAIAPVLSFSALGPNSDRDTLIDALLLARSRAQPHGVSVQGDTFVVFEGLSYADRREEADYPFPFTSTTEGDTEFLFSFQEPIEEKTIGWQTNPQYRIDVSKDGRIEEFVRVP